VGTYVDETMSFEGLKFVAYGKEVHALVTATEAWRHGEDAGANATPTKWTFAADGEVWGPPVRGPGGRLLFGSWDKQVYALRAESGKLLWRFATGGAVVASPSVVLGTAYVGSLDNHVYALDVDTGEKKWEFATGGDVTATPSVGGATIDPTVYVTSMDTKVYALRAFTGEKRWEFSTGFALRASAVLEGNDLVMVGSVETQLFALDPKNGAVVWSAAGAGAPAPPRLASRTKFPHDPVEFYANPQAHMPREVSPYGMGPTPAPTVTAILLLARILRRSPLLSTLAALACL
jgi:outer membrane protein assembly factor BamB